MSMECLRKIGPHAGEDETLLKDCRDSRERSIRFNGKHARAKEKITWRDPKKKNPFLNEKYAYIIFAEELL